MANKKMGIKWRQACDRYKENPNYEPVIRKLGLKLGMTDQEIDGHLDAYRLLYGVVNQKLFARMYPHLV